MEALSLVVEFGVGGAALVLALRLGKVLQSLSSSTAATDQRLADLVAVSESHERRLTALEARPWPQE